VLCKQGVAGSNPVTSTNIFLPFKHLLVGSLPDFRKLGPIGSNKKFLHFNETGLHRDLKSAGSITDTNAARPSLPGFVHLNLSETTLRSAATNFPRVCVRKYRVHRDRSELFASVSQQLFKTPTGLLVGTGLAQTQ
jgi:hypothetical protein